MINLRVSLILDDGQKVLNKAIEMEINYVLAFFKYE